MVQRAWRIRTPADTHTEPLLPAFLNDTEQRPPCLLRPAPGGGRADEHIELDALGASTGVLLFDGDVSPTTHAIPVCFGAGEALHFAYGCTLRGHKLHAIRRHDERDGQGPCDEPGVEP